MNQITKISGSGLKRGLNSVFVPSSIRLLVFWPNKLSVLCQYFFPNLYARGRKSAVCGFVNLLIWCECTGGFSVCARWHETDNLFYTVLLKKHRTGRTGRTGHFNNIWLKVNRIVISRLRFERFFPFFTMICSCLFSHNFGNCMLSPPRRGSFEFCAWKLGGLERS